jgi:hypothetical protein
MWRVNLDVKGWGIKVHLSMLRVEPGAVSAVSMGSLGPLGVSGVSAVSAA